MTHRKVGNNRVLRKDESGTYYKDIVFVPSGSLSMNNNPTASTSSTRSREEDINEIREINKQLVNTRIQYHIICSAFVNIECALTAANHTIKHYFTPARIKHNLKHIGKTNTTEHTSNVGRNCAEELEPRHPIRINYHRCNITA
ncbi:hypothetical protein KI688_000641 [Linnemannia hyalina]|uniref:Uncharacterized protein n=1 Tax=Linnemannia hyalina TaxID=64524 RepID=A0A9P7Y4Y7_9FUNG|nr:hypothetical protein KI688_000641 [Linnemannia hyalina]